MIQRLPTGSTGWTLDVTGADRATLDRVQGLPFHCPGCDEVRIPYRNRRRLPPTDPAAKRSPIRTMGLGFSRVAQILSGGVLRQLPADQRRLVVFSDSRQDAARIGPDLARNHFQDVLRAQLVAALDERPDFSKAKQAAEGDASAEAVEAFNELRAQMPALADALARQPHLQTDADRALINVGEWELRAPTIEQLIDRVEVRLATLGLNPGGPGPSLFKEGGANGRHWHELYSWDGNRMSLRNPLPVNLSDYRDVIRGSLTVEVLSNLFSGVGRDIESLAIAVATVNRSDVPAAHRSGIDQAVFNEIVHSALRILCLRLRFPEAERDPSNSPGDHLKSYLKVVADSRNVLLDDLVQDVADAIGTPASAWLLRPYEVRLLSPPRLSLPAPPWVASSDTNGHVWTWPCSRCLRVHLHASAGVCTACFAQLKPPQPYVPDDSVFFESDYYRHLAVSAERMFRLNTSELTGQIGADEAAEQTGQVQGDSRVDC